ncbi:hypothetical protein HPB47_023052 [Ixodes persulcatus]|uniref:Uncharacterized protein n=1 Tax=Ixodes persulcatus TaxID=34615 RepID=A0AC60QAC1_IXOPE|nr:hypothetical protein HPB47_023052 [Ixodes persulcatus]
MKETIWILLLLEATSGHATNVVRETKLGKVRGKLVRVDATMVEEYKGIPFAEPPIGDLRFKEPVPKKSWEGSWDATNGGTTCHQAPRRNGTTDSAELTEDCLHLNIWAPADAAKSPVLVWIHGGGFAYGGSSLDYYDGQLLAASTRVLVVSMNYRVGILGFLNANSPEAQGNQGLLDQNLALKWIQEHIDVFGGDPAMVTVIGQSAGAMSIHAHILSPLSKGLFKRAVMLSGSHNNLDFVDSIHGSVIKGDNVAKLLGSLDEIVTFLVLTSAEEIELPRSRLASLLGLTSFPHFSLPPHIPQSARQGESSGAGKRGRKTKRVSCLSVSVRSVCVMLTTFVLATSVIRKHNSRREAIPQNRMPSNGIGDIGRLEAKVPRYLRHVLCREAFSENA